MPKTLTNKEYFEKIINKEHRPRTWDIGDQRDPDVRICCICLFPFEGRGGKFPSKEEVAAFEYNRHLVEILDKEFFFLEGHQDDYR